MRKSFAASVVGLLMMVLAVKVFSLEVLCSNFGCMTGTLGTANGGTNSTSWSAGSIIFAGSGGTSLTQNNPQCFWDNTNNRLGIGLASPQTTLHIIGTPSTRAIQVISPDPAQTGTVGATTAEFSVWGTSYAAATASMLDLLAYSTNTLPTSPHFRISNHWEGTASSGTIAIGFNVGTTFNDVLSVSTNNFVGIRTVNPGTALHVSSGTLTIDGNTNNMLDLSGASALMGIRTTNPAQALHVSSGTILVDGNVANAFIAPGTSQLVGIGTANPGTELHVSSGVVTIDGTSPGLNIGTGIPGSNALVAMQNTSGTTYLDLERDSAGTGESMVVFGDNTTRRWYLGQRNTGVADFHLYGAGAGDDVLKVRYSNGFVGIGITGANTVATKLHMSSGTFTVDGNVQLVANFGGTVRAWSRTQAQIDGITPGAAGEIVYCSNCSTVNICVSTGTTVSGFRRVDSATAGCGSGN